ncbi:MAG: AraC-type DNA-binding protein [Variovorax sp.]|nr:AraC-type DNA-binding protein [Variovorax sp.]
MELNYSTHAVTMDQRFDYWSDVVCKHFIPASSRVSNRDKFDASFSVRSLGNLTLAEMSSPHHSWERTPQHLRTGPNEDFMLSLMVSGRGVLSQSGRTVVQQAGNIVLYDAARPFSYDLEPQSVLLLRVPRKQLLFRVPEADKLTAINLAAGHSVGTLLASMVREAAVIDLPGHQAAQVPLAASLLDMLAVVLQMQVDGCATALSSREALFRGACDYINEHLDDCEMDVEQIAAAKYVSARTLTRVFAEHGTTPMHWLWQRRLEASHCALIEGRVRQVTQAAFQNGFSDLSHFCRVFKKTYGTTPHTLLRSN